MAVDTREDYVEKLLRLLHDRPVANVLLIVESEAGLEVLPSYPGITGVMGLLRAAETFVDERFRAGMNQSEQTKREQSLEQEYSMKTNGKAN